MTASPILETTTYYMQQPTTHTVLRTSAYWPQHKAVENENYQPGIIIFYFFQNS